MKHFILTFTMIVAGFTLVACMSTDSGQSTEGSENQLPGGEVTSNQGATAADQQSALALIRLELPTAISGNDFTLPVTLQNPLPVAGFQFRITGGRLLGAEGGSAEEHGFEVVTHENGGLLGFSLELQTLPSDQTTLTEVTVVPLAGATEICITDLILADDQGRALDSQIDSNSCTSIE